MAPWHCLTQPRTTTSQHQTPLTIGQRGWCSLQTAAASAFDPREQPFLSCTHLLLLCRCRLQLPHPLHGLLYTTDREILLLGTCEQTCRLCCYQQSSAQGSKLSMWELCQRKAEGMWHGQGEPQMLSVIDHLSLDRERSHSLGASCTRNHGRWSHRIIKPWNHRMS